LWPVAAEGKLAAECFGQLVALYSEPHRHYHNQQHIVGCLEEFDLARELAHQPIAVELAIWFHDAVYDARAADNEERSAQLAQAWLSKTHAEPAMMDAVSHLVLATKRHDASLHVDAGLLVDVDLSILGQTQNRFWDYESQIRAEYSWVPAEIFSVKRAEILEGFLARRRIYNTDLFFGRLEGQARINLQASIRHLRNPSSV
jgi:predicted metal-dependent HD superfamily phosphohydrolase